MKKTLIIIMLLVIITTVLSGCGAKETSAAPQQITFARGTDIITLDPFNGNATSTSGMMSFLYSSLTRTDNDGNVIGDLAESFKAIDDNTWVFYLRKGVKFHNGEEFNAYTVKYNVERMSNPKLKFALSSDFAFIKEAKIIDDFTVTIVTKEPFAGLPLRMTYMKLVPSKYIEEKGNDYFVKNPVGTGPYKFVEWMKDVRVVLQANEEYYNGAPRIKKVTFKTIPEDAARIAALEAGDVDLISGIPTNQIAQLKKNGQLEVVTFPTSRVIYLGMNTLNSELMKNKKFRQALNYSVDVDSIIKNILNGNGKRLATALAPQYFGYSEEIKPYTYNPDKAKQLLQEAGYKNEPIQLVVPPGTYVNGKEVAEAIAGQLRQTGINVNAMDKEGALLKTDLAAGKIEPLYMLGLGGPHASAELITRIAFGMKERYSAYYNEDMDKLRMQASRTLDEKQSVVLWKQMQEKLKEEAPAIFLYQQYEIYAYNKKLKDWKPRVDEAMLLDRSSIGAAK